MSAKKTAKVKSELELWLAEELRDLWLDGQLKRLYDVRDGYREDDGSWWPIYPGRMWRPDFCWIEERLVVEIEGGSWSGGRHTRGQGFEDDCHKYNTLTLAGWMVLRFTSAMLFDGTAGAMILMALAKEE